MLVVKKIETKKLVSYLVVIAIMLFGTGFFVYKNYQLTAGRKNVAASFVSAINEDAGANFSKNEDNTSLSQTVKKKKQEEIDIFDNEKIKLLKKNEIKAIDFRIGKENPFQPETALDEDSDQGGNE